MLPIRKPDTYIKFFVIFFVILGIVLKFCDFVIYSSLVNINKANGSHVEVTAANVAYNLVLLIY